MPSDPKPVATCKRGHPRTDENTYVNPRGIKECRVCQREQQRAWKKRHPEAERRYKAQPTEVVCPSCGEKRTVTRNHRNSGASLCPSCAHRKAGERFKRGRDIACPTCGNLFYVAAGRIGTRKFCSTECLHNSEEHRAQMRDREGKKNPAYKHGHTAGNNIRGWGPSFKGEGCCRVCGSTEMLHLHHIIPRSKSRAARRDLRNGITLCNSCHMRWHRGGKNIPRELLREEEWLYVSSVVLTGENVEAWLDMHYPPQLP